MSITSRSLVHYQSMVKKNVGTPGDFHALSVKEDFHLLQKPYLVTVYQVMYNVLSYSC